MTVPAEIFREYDVRGVVGEQLNVEVAGALGAAVGTKMVRQGAKRLVIGRDHRPSGMELTQALIEGVTSSGCNVEQIGVTPTPVGYWSIEKLGADGGIHVTGSHNPSNYNGFKLTLLGRSLHGDDIQELRRIIEAGDMAHGAGEVREHGMLDDYVSDLQSFLAPAKRPLKVVLDAGNGTAGLTAVPLYRRLGYEVVPLYCELDGSFPNHHPDPTVEENLADLKREVARTKADLGLAFDGDGDRVGVVDRDGTVVWGDRLMILFAREVLREVPGATIIGEVKCSKTLYDDIAAHGGRPVMWRTGHSLIKAKMREEKAALAGEMSGHIFFKHRYYGFDDATYAGARLLEALGFHDRSLGELLADVPATVSTPEIRSDCPEEIKFDLVRRVVERFKERSATEPFSVIDIDGARVEWQDGWGLVRPSNTQPLLVLRFEAETQARLDEIQREITQEIDRARRELGG